MPEDITLETELEAQIELINKGKSPLELGLSYDPASLHNTRVIERTYDSPGTMLDDNWPYKTWGRLSEVFFDMARKASADGMRYVYITCYEYAKVVFKNKITSMSPMRAQLELFDLQQMEMANHGLDPRDPKHSEIVGMVQRVFREQCYALFQKEFVGR